MGSFVNRILLHPPDYSGGLLALSIYKTKGTALRLSSPLFDLS